jgi:IS5 family transposase
MNPDIINDGGPVKRKRCGGGRAFHSRLEPFADFIREQRQRRRTWQEIAAVLFSEKGCAITAQGVHQFYRRYLHRRAQTHWEETPSVLKVTTAPANAAPAPARKPILAATPPPREVRRPNLDDIKLNDPTNI